MYIQVQGDDSIKQFSIQPSYIPFSLCTIISCEKSHRTVEAFSAKYCSGKVQNSGALSSLVDTRNIIYHENRVYSAHVLAKRTVSVNIMRENFQNSQLHCNNPLHLVFTLQNVLEIEESLLK